MAKKKYRVKEGHTFGRGDKPDTQVKAGEIVELTSEEAETYLGWFLEEVTTTPAARKMTKK